MHNELNQKGMSKVLTSLSNKAEHNGMSVKLVVLSLCTTLFLSSCGGGDGAGGKKGAAVEVGVVVAQPQTVAIATELPGRVEASRVAQVRARVAGILEKRLFTEGSDVQAGQLLMKIDPAPYQAEFQSAKAELIQAEVNERQAAAVVTRYRPLVKSNAISKLDFDNANSDLRAATARVGVAKARLRSAEINLGYADVVAPISGRIGRALVTEGALVGQGDATELAVIQQINPVYVNFTQSHAETLKLQRLMEEGKLERIDGQEGAKVEIVLDDGSLHKESGTLLFSDLTVDKTSGQVTLRANVPNNDGVLLPGMYVRVRIEQAKLAGAFLIPQQSVSRGGREGDTVIVVDDKGGRQVRPVKIRAARGNNWIIESGLKAGEKVMVDGFQRVQMLPPDAKLKPVLWKQPNNGLTPTESQKQSDDKAGKQGA